MSAELKTQVYDIIGDKPADTWKVKEVIRKIIEHTSTATSDDVRFYVKKFTPSNMIIGAAFQQLVQEGFLKKQGTKKTDVKSSKGRDIAVYVQAQ